MERPPSAVTKQIEAQIEVDGAPRPFRKRRGQFQKSKLLHRSRLIFAHTIWRDCERSLIRHHKKGGARGGLRSVVGRRARLLRRSLTGRWNHCGNRPRHRDVFWVGGHAPEPMIIYFPNANENAGNRSAYRDFY